MHLAPYAEVSALAAVLLAIVARATGAVTTLGAVVGVGIGCGVAAGFGAAGFLALGTFFVAGSLLTRIGWKTKTARGAAEATGGARDARRVVGKGAVAAALGVAVAMGGPPAALQLAFAGALAAALADTAGTEIGTLSASSPRTLPSLRVVAHGTPGAVSMSGLLGSLFGAVVIAIAVGQLGAVDIGLRATTVFALCVVALAGFTAALLESLVVGIAPSVRSFKGWVRNLFTTAAGAALALLAAPFMAAAQ